jgi:hypothetical protein
VQIPDRHKEDELEVYLEPGERILWYGIPKQGILFSRSDIFLIPFSLLWGGFAIFWELMVFSSDAPLIFVIWGIPFVLIGIYLIAGRFFVDAHRRKKTIYGITDKRIIIKTGMKGQLFREGKLAELASIKMKTKKDNSGSIIFSFGRKLTEPLSGSNTARRTIMTFNNIHDVKSVNDRVVSMSK